MITFVFTYRNRELRTVKNCLNSLATQSATDFLVTLVDYGSSNSYSEELKELTIDYPFVTLVYVPAIDQLWNKCRAINMALKQCKTPFFFVGDVDMIFHQDFVQTLLSFVKKDENTYFQVGFLSEEESETDKEFQNYTVSFTSSNEATGMTLFKTENLKSINGFDEFYHGWGGEDTDVHARFQNAGFRIQFYDERIMVLHQWHPKAYRSKDSTKPFHSNLERINQRYLALTRQTNRTLVNLDSEWGKVPDVQAYNKLETPPDHIIQLAPIDRHVASLLAQLKNYKNEVVTIEISDVAVNQKGTQKLKKLLNKKYDHYLSMELVNNLLLEEIIKNYRNLPYAFHFDRSRKVIKLTIVF